MKGKGAKTIKKVVSIILALAMVVTGVNYTPVSVNAAEDFNTVKWQNIYC